MHLRTTYFRLIPQIAPSKFMANYQQPKFDPQDVPPRPSSARAVRPPSPQTKKPALKAPTPPYVAEAETNKNQNKRPASSKRSLFWPGFSLSLLVLSILTCGGLSMLLNINPIRLAQLRGQQISWEPPSLAPDSLPEVDTLPRAEFQIGQRVQNLTNSLVNIRRSPGYLGKPDGDILFQVPPEAEMEILAIPESVDGLQWWRILYVADSETVIEGWVAEATASGVQILGN